MPSVISSVSQRDASVGGRLRSRLGIAGRLLRAVVRSATDPTLRKELLSRLFEYEEFVHLLNAVARPSIVAGIDASGSAPFPLLVTTNKGLFLLHASVWRCLLPVTCFGLSRDGDTLYLGVSAGIHSFVLSAHVSNGPEHVVLSDVRILIRYETRYHNERIHQIAFDPCRQQVVCANSRRNSLLVVDAGSGAIIDEKFLFTDATGFPIYTDQNHLNSVTPYGDVLLFTAHSAGKNGGALGFVADDYVRAYHYASRGAHDVMVHDGGIMFTDSFRAGLAATRPDVSGAVRFRGNDYRLDATDAVPRKIMVRGLVARDGVLVVGYSAYAKREVRPTAARGGVIIAGADGSRAAIDGPFSQVYDVLPFDGLRSDHAGAPCSVEELDCLFRRDVGPLLYEAPVARSARLAELR
jgi:hypothetical protein